MFGGLVVLKSPVLHIMRRVETRGVGVGVGVGVWCVDGIEEVDRARHRHGCSEFEDDDLMA
jgi:hypothetical protein